MGGCYVDSSSVDFRYIIVIDSADKYLCTFSTDINILNLIKGSVAWEDAPSTSPETSSFDGRRDVVYSSFISDLLRMINHLQHI